MAEEGAQSDLSKYSTYEDYLDSQVGAVDRVYVEDPATRRALVELGYRGSGETLRRDVFEARKGAERERHLFKDLAPVHLLGAGRDYAGRPLMAALAAREELVRNGKLAVLLYLRCANARGQEVSAYIDFGHRLKCDAWEPIFAGSAPLLPRPTDLSFYNWATGVASNNTTPTFSVITDCGVAGVLFKVKRDRKVRVRGGVGGAPAWPRAQGVPCRPSSLFRPQTAHPPTLPARRPAARAQIISVDPQKAPGDNTTRTEVPTTEFLQACIFDHFSR